MLPLLFFKRLSDVYEEEYQALLERFEDEGIAKRKFHHFTIPEGCLWGDIRVVAQNVGQRLNDTLAQIASGDCRLKAACQAERAEEQNRRVIDGRTSSEMDHKNTFLARLCLQ